MKDKSLREALKGLSEDVGFDVMILDDQAYDKSIVGVTEDGRLVYDYWKMVEELSEDDGCTPEEAVEWIDYNTMRAIPYMGERAPIVVKYDREYVLEAYGREQ